MKKIDIIITAGGSGLRMGSDLPKQFLLLNGVPILCRTIEFFASLPIKSDIYVAIPPLSIDLWHRLCWEYGMDVPCKVVSGGITRFHSVRNVLEHIGSGGVVAVHDGVRPVLDREMVKRCLELATVHPAVVPVLEVRESMRKMEGAKSVAVDRLEYRLVQTPQVFDAGVLIDAYKQSYLPQFTDDASVVERAGVPLFLTKGDVRNIKITTPEDLALAELLVPPSVRSAVFDPDLPLNGLVKGD
ncbi:MAG: 2-C-methyl-D-erythritol 4-phosphate cytidylyltransferase [Prevotellaceae bacterium]|nr:2-C-methyl-D-erythritol 4-phosphate cytidylyltransferase [Prevotellaceae bacterium]